MGGARWDSDTYRTYATSTSLNSLSVAQTFVSRCIKEGLDPSKFGIRESRDSDQNPNSVPIIFALDVTGSMGRYAAQIAKETLPEIMETLMAKLDPIADPHLMFMGVGDVVTDRAPLQVSQFEADLRILETLRDIWLEGGGGGNATESYDLPWYFAAHRTSTDQVEKRGGKGYLFTFGDEMPPSDPLTEKQLKKVFGNDTKLPSAGTTSELLSKAQEKYKTFHIVIEQGSHCSFEKSKKLVRGAWTELMGPNVLFLRDSNYLTQLVLATMKIAEGQDMETVLLESECKDELEYAFTNTMQTA